MWEVYHNEVSSYTDPHTITRHISDCTYTWLPIIISFCNEDANQARKWTNWKMCWKLCVDVGVLTISQIRLVYQTKTSQIDGWFNLRMDLSKSREIAMAEKYSLINQRNSHLQNDKLVDGDDYVVQPWNNSQFSFPLTVQGTTKYCSSSSLRYGVHVDWSHISLH